MQVVVDSGVDLCLSPQQMKDLQIHQIPLSVTLRGKTYREGKDISREDFYSLLSQSSDFPITSQPSPGVFAEAYQDLAKNDPEILSVHVSSGLSGTINAAKLGATLVPQAQITHFDTKTLSVTSGWQAVSAARALKLGWDKSKVLALLKRISDAANCMFTLKDLRYLIHGGRISHIKGLMASLLNIKPIIGVEKQEGKYEQLGQSLSFSHAIKRFSGLIERHHTPGSVIRAQVVHGQNAEGAELLKKTLENSFKCKWLPTSAISLVLGAHTGPSVVGVAFALETSLADTP
ncbi:MAG: DegV family protein [Dehalococcoidia bacterium]|nr:DegV family protein [Dehalococcoidia bacterium]